NVICSGLVAVPVGASTWTVPVSIFSPGSGVVLDPMVIVIVPGVGLVTDACTGSLGVAPVLPVSVLTVPLPMTVFTSSRQCESQPSPLVALWSSHCSTPV